MTVKRLSRLFFLICTISGIAGEQSDDLYDYENVATLEPPDYDIPVQRNEFPWMVRIESQFAGKEQPVKCGASLIHKRWVLTAAHCVRNVFNQRLRTARMVTLFFGEYDLMKPNEEGVINSTARLRWKYIEIHQNFSYITFHYDIALIKIRRRLDMSDIIAPIQLPTAAECQSEFYNSSTSTINGCSSTIEAGWGNPTSNTSHVLRRLSRSVTAFSNCERKYGLTFSTTQTCMAGTDVCEGDHGGPLMCFIWAIQQYRLIGVKSNTCDPQENSLGVYTRICSVLDWIRGFAEEEQPPTTTTPLTTSTTQQNCGSLPDVTRGSFSIGFATVGSSRMLICQNDSIAIGAPSIFCRPEGTWSEPGSCLKLEKILPPTTTTTTTTTTTATTTTTTTPSTTTSPTTPFLLPTVTQAQWAGGQITSCVIPPVSNAQVQVVDLTRGMGAAVDPGTHLQIGSVIRLLCDSASRPTTNNLTISACQTTGIWLPSVGDCYRTACLTSELPQIGNGAFTGINNPSIAFGENAVAECSDGYQETGPLSATCQNTGKWTTPDNACRRVYQTTTAPQTTTPFVEGLYGEWTELHQAAQDGSLSEVRRLVRAGSELTATADYESYGDMPIHEACFYGHLDVVKFMVWYEPTLLQARRSSDGALPIHLAAMGGQIPVLDYFISLVQVSPDVRDLRYGRTPLHLASVLGYLSVVKWLINKGASAHAKSYPNQFESQAVHLASYQGHGPVVQYLVQQVDTELAASRDLLGDMPIHYAALGGHVNLVEYFIDQLGVWVEAPNNIGRTPLHKACEEGQLPLVKWLIWKGAKPTTRSYISDWESLPIHIASDVGYLPAIKYFVEEVNTSFANSGDSQGNLPIHRASMGGRLGIVHYFVFLRNMSIEVRQERWGKTPLHWASEYGHVDLVKWLDSKNVNVTATTNSGNTALHLAAFKGHFEVVQFFVEQYPQTMDLENDNGETALAVAERGTASGAQAVIDYIRSKETSE